MDVPDPLRQAFADTAPAAMLWFHMDFMDREVLMASAELTGTQRAEIYGVMWWDIPYGYRVKLREAMARWGRETEQDLREHEAKRLSPGRRT